MQSSSRFIWSWIWLTRSSASMYDNRRLSRGSSAGDVPRRSLAVVTGVSSLAVVGAATFGISTREIVLLTIGAFVLVYLLGCAGAVKLLPRRTWAHRSAVLALASSVLLLVMAGPYLLWPLTVAAAALAYHQWRGRAARRTRPDESYDQPVAEPANASSA